MALIDVNYYSHALSRQVTYKALVPTDPRKVQKGTQSEKKYFKTMYLLHGIMGDCNDWIVNTRVSLLAEQYNIAIIMPSGDNSFYVDNESLRNYYGRFIGQELVEETRKLFPLSNNRDDTFIAGLSMGGYGALRNGLKYSDTFGSIAALSAALIIDDAIHSTEEVVKVFNRNNYEALFGDLTKLKGSDKDIEALVRGIKHEGRQMPRIYLACGTEDSLLVNNRMFKDFLVSENVAHSYIESPGSHNWKFWDEYIEKVLVWLT